MPTRDIYIQITKDCIHDCIFCSAPKKKEYLPLDEIKRRIDYYCKYNYTDINITGGEPTLHPDLDKIIAYGVSKGLNVRMTTNGVLLKDFDYIKKLKKAGLNRILFSVHHYDPKEEQKITSADYEDLPDTLKAIENADKLGFDININITIIKQNYKVLPKIINMLIPRFKNIHHFNFNFVDIYGNVLKHGNALKPQDIAPRYSEAEKYLVGAFKILKKHGVNFRFERAPLCYAPGFEEYNSNANRAVGSEFHVTTFTEDVDPDVDDNDIGIVKSEACKSCFLKDICYGIEHNYAKIYGTSELYPVFTNPNIIERKIKKQNNYKEPLYYEEIKENSVEELTNKFGSIRALLRRDRKIVVLVKEVSESILKQFFETCLKYKINTNNITLIYLKSNPYTALEKTFGFRSTNITKTEMEKKTVIDSKVFSILTIPKIIEETSYVAYLTKVKNKESILEFFFNFIPERLKEKAKKDKINAILDMYTLLKPKIKMALGEIGNVIGVTRDAATIDYLSEKLLKANHKILDDVSERYLGPENVDAVDLIKVKEKKEEAKNNETMYAKNDNCAMCKACVQSCPQKAISVKDNKIVVDPNLCNMCGICVKVCPNDQFIVKKK